MAAQPYDGIRIFVSAPQGKDPRLAALRTLLSAWGVAAYFPTPTREVGGQLTEQAQAAIRGCTIFLRLCTEETPRAYWMSLEAGTFLGLQSDDYRQGRTAQRQQVNIILDRDYAVAPFDRAGVFIDAASAAPLVWLNQLRAALRLAPLTSLGSFPVALFKPRRKFPRRAVVTAGLAVVGLAATGTAIGLVVKQLGHQPIVIGPPTPTPTVAPSATKKWAFATGGLITAAVAVAAGVVYAGSEDGQIYAIDAATGAKRWSVNVGGASKFPVRRTPAIANGLVFTQADNPDTETSAPMYALRSADGSQAWQLPGTGRFPNEFSDLLIANNALYVPGYYLGLVGALDPATGKELAAAPQVGSSTGFSGVTIVNSTLYGGTDDGGVYAVDVSNKLRLQWLQIVNNTNQSATIRTTPAVANNTVYVGSTDGNLYALNATTGKQLWHYSADDAFSSSSPVVVNGLVLIGSDDHALHAVDATTGTGRWKALTGGKVYSSPTVANGLVYFGSFDNLVYAVEIATGKVVKRYQTNGPVVGAPSIVGNVLYIGSEDNYVYAFDL